MVMLKKKFLIFISVIMLVVISISMISCEKPEEEVPQEEIKYYEDTPYDMKYVIDGYTYRLNLDGDGNGTLYKSASSADTFSTNAVGFNSTGKFLSFQTSSSNRFELHFLTDGKAVEKQETPPSNAYSSKEEIPDGKTFIYSTTGFSDGYEVKIEYEFKYIKSYEGKLLMPTIEIVRKMTLAEFMSATGTYKIKNFDKVKLTMDMDVPPSGVFASNEISSNIYKANNVISEEVINNEEVGFAGVVKVIPNQLNTRFNRFVQLFDDGHFEFVHSTASPKESTLTTGYKGKSFTQSYIRYYNGDRYEYTAQISFENSNAAYVTYEITSCKLDRHYQISQNEEGENILNQIYYDVDIYNSFIGSHTIDYTGNNINFANNGNIEILYNDKYYDFTVENLVIEEYLDYDHVLISKPGVGAFAIFLYKDGSWEWDLQKISAL